MVALKKYARIEASGLWRATADAQRRDVIVVLGDATLTIKTTNDQPLAHWSLAAIDRANPGETPARFHPDGDPSEELELAGNETEMVEAIETLRRAVDRARPHPGRLRLAAFATSVVAVLAVAVLWLPGALVDHTLSVVPPAGRAEIGQSLFSRLQRVTGPACGTSSNTSSLARFGARLEAPNLAVMRGGLETTLALPGRRILLARQLLEDHEEPDVAAGYVLAERARSAQTDPLRRLLSFAGPLATFRLLTTGALDPETLDAYAEHMLTADRAQAEDSALLALFGALQIRSSPYAYARDVTGESVLALIEADPMRGKTAEPLLSDADWLRLQAICGD